MKQYYSICILNGIMRNIRFRRKLIGWDCSKMAYCCAIFWLPSRRSFYPAFFDLLTKRKGPA